jgi:hypothetical protein
MHLMDKLFLNSKYNTKRGSGLVLHHPQLKFTIPILCANNTPRNHNNNILTGNNRLIRRYACDIYAYIADPSYIIE